MFHSIPGETGFVCTYEFGIDILSSTRMPQTSAPNPMPREVFSLPTYCLIYYLVSICLSSIDTHTHIYTYTHTYIIYHI